MQGNERTFSLTIIWLTAGLTVAGIWTDVLGYSMKLPLDSLAGGSVFFLLGRLCIGVLFIILGAKIMSTLASAVRTMSFMMSLATALMIIAYHQTLLDPALLASTGAIIDGAGYAFIVWPFYFIFAEKVDTDKTVIAIALSLVFETIFSIIISLYLDPQLQMVLVIGAPMVCAAFYFLARRSSASERSLVPLRKHTSGFAKYAYVAEVLIFSAALVFIRALSSIGILGNARTNFTGMSELSIPELVIISVLVLAMSYLVFILPRNRLSLSLRCVMGFVVMLAGLQILALSSDLEFSYSFDSISVATELFAHLVCWMIAIECMRVTDIPYFRLAGFRNVLYAVLSLTWALYFSKLEFATSTFVMVVVYVLLLAVMLIVIRKHFVEDATFWVGPEDGDDASFLAFAKSQNLTARETQIFSLLMSGDKRAEIERECSLSEGTVKTHISNMYKKLDVHSKRELMEAFEKSLTGKTAPVGEHLPKR